jgi:hypothetical protein
MEPGTAQTAKFVIRKKRIEENIAAPAIFLTVWSFVILRPITIARMKLPYVAHMTGCNPRKISVISIVVNVIISAFLIPNFAPENNAIAPTEVIFAGCGAMRESIPIAIKVIISILCVPD